MLFLLLTAKNRRTAELSNEVEAIADIYVCVLKIDLKKDTLKLIRINEGKDNFMISQSSKAFKKNAETMAKTMSSDQSRNLVVSFMDPEIKHLMTERKAGMFCVMDADNFKSINDNYGHKTGDIVIIAIAECMKASFRNNDVVFRLGGDEFAAFSEGVINQETGRRIIDRFLKNIDNINIPELGDRKISISVGASFYLPDNTDSFEALYTRADEGAYESKSHEGSYVTFK